MDSENEYITAKKRVELEQELAELKGPRRKEILEALEFSKSLGDLSENAEYHEARDAQRGLEERIAKIEHVLKNAQIIKNSHSGKIEVGSTIFVQKEGIKDKKQFQIVGSEETDMAQGKISNKSPLGMALLGKKKGETALFLSPGGTVKYKIIDIE